MIAMALQKFQKKHKKLNNRLYFAQLIAFDWAFFISSRVTALNDYYHGHAIFDMMNEHLRKRTE